MKKIVTLVTLSFVLTSVGQTKIYETELSKDKIRTVQCKYSHKLNKIIVNSVSKNKGLIFNNSKLIDENAIAVDLVKDDTFTSIYYSEADNTYYTEDMIGFYKPANYNFYVGDKISKSTRKIVNKELDYFDKDRLLFLTGQKDDDVILNIEKDNFFLNAFDYKNNKIIKSKLDKPDYKRLKGEDKMRLRGIGLSKDNPSSFSTNYYNNKFEIYSKTTFTDHNSSIIYRTIYNDLGKIEKDIQYDISLDNYTFGYMIPTNSFNKNRSHTSRNIYTYTSGKYTYNKQVVDLDINDFFIDSNSDFYVYGMYIKEGGMPGGFYIHKFLSDGNLIWKKTYEVLDVNNFNKKKQDWNMTGIALKQFSNENQLVLNVKGPSSYRDRYNHYFIIDKNNGDLLKKSQIEANTDYNTFGSLRSFGSTYYNTFTKSINLSDDGLLAYALNDKINKHINGYSKPKNDIYFDAIISAKGIWLIETDNESKYSITLYKE
jgi:hypothetical protein